MVRFRTETMLIVEDDVTLGKVLQRALARDGLTILHAINSGEALQLAEHHRPRLVLLDCGLRSDDGLELAAALQRRLSVIAMAEHPSGVCDSSPRAVVWRASSDQVD
jgi:two-component system, OmpR family, response regulator